jgi:hypothetical protein
LKKGKCSLKENNPYPSLPLDQGERSLSRDSFETLMKDVLDKGVPFRFRAAGYSMSPFIKDGDVLTVDPISFRLPKRGDVVVFKKSATGEIVVHRVLKKMDEAYLVKGDNLLDEDGRVYKKDIFGTVKAVDRNGRAVRFGIRWGKGMIACLNRGKLLAALLLLARKAIRPSSRDPQK